MGYQNLLEEVLDISVLLPQGGSDRELSTAANATSG
jgi:hypothetical protein